MTKPAGLLGPWGPGRLRLAMTALEDRDGHTFYRCDDPCDSPGRCQWCDGGLAACTTCRGAEGDLPTECPGRPITAAEARAIYAGHLDYKHGTWTRKVIALPWVDLYGDRLRSST